MTEQEKELLLKTLCALLPYGVKGIRTYKDYETVEVYDIIPKCKMNPNIGDGIFTEISFTNMDCCTIEGFKPYLRPLSSMTDEERKELSGYENSVQRVDFFYSHHIDCRFMIEKGLALETPEGMYN